MANVINVQVYKINSNQIVPGRYGKAVAFSTAGLVIQAVTGTTLAEYQGGTSVLLYSAIRATATGDAVFYSPSTVAQIVTAANT